MRLRLRAEHADLGGAPGEHWACMRLQEDPLGCRNARRLVRSRESLCGAQRGGGDCMDAVEWASLHGRVWGPRSTCGALTHLWATEGIAGRMAQLFVHPTAAMRGASWISAGEKGRLDWAVAQKVFEKKKLRESYR